jgi:DNA topoisomerase-3
VAAIEHNLGQLNGQAIATLPLNLQQKSRAWNDAKVSAHHAIIPTLKRHSGLSKAQNQVYGLVSRNYLIQFMAAYEFASTEVEVSIAAGVFIAKALEPKVDGWKQLFPKRSAKAAGSDSNDEPDQLLPTLTKGQTLASLEALLLAKSTSAPKAYSDATLLAAMTGIGAHVSDPAVRKILKDTDGLGTEATRAGIIELLFKRGFLLRQGKSIVASDTGRIFITALPEVATTPDMTARWEAQLTAIAEGRGQYQALMEPLTAQLQDMTVASRSVLPKQLKGLGTAKAYGKKKRTRKKSA